MVELVADVHASGGCKGDRVGEQMTDLRGQLSQQLLVVLSL